MPTYEYKCNECQHHLEIKQSFSDAPLVDCPKCKLPELERIISGGLASFISKDPTTIGQLAERNTAKMGHYELQEKRQFQKESEEHSKAQALHESGVKERPTPFYGKADHKKIASLDTPEKVQKYILEGK